MHSFALDFNQYRIWFFKKKITFNIFNLWKKMVQEFVSNIMQVFHYF